MESKLAARKVGSLKGLKESLKRGSGAGLIQSVPTDGITVRFLAEPDTWIGYYEYYDSEANAFIPMAEGEQLPKGVRPSMRYLGNAVIVSDHPQQDRVVALKMAKTLAVSLVAKFEKYDTLLDRDYELDRIGEGFDTTYDVTPEAPSKRNMRKYEAMDLEDVLAKSRASGLGIDLNGDGEVVEDDDAKPAAKAAKAGTARGGRKAAAVEPDDDEDEPDDDEDEPDDDDDDDIDPPAEAEADEAEDEAEDDDEDPFTIDTAIEAADEGDEDAADWLNAYVEAEGITVDPSEYEWWSEWWAEAKPKPAPAKKAAAKKAAPAKAAPAKKAPAKKAAAVEPEDEDEEDDADEADAVEVDEDTLNEMSVAELRALADEYGIEHKGLAKVKLVKAILDAAEE